MPTISIHAPGMPRADLDLLEKRIRDLGKTYEIYYELDDAYPYGQTAFDFISLKIHNAPLPGVAANVSKSLMNIAGTFAVGRYNKWTAVERPHRVSLYGLNARNSRIDSKEIIYGKKQKFGAEAIKK